MRQQNFKINQNPIENQGNQIFNPNFMMNPNMNQINNKFGNINNNVNNQMNQNNFIQNNPNCFNQQMFNNNIGNNIPQNFPQFFNINNMNNGIVNFPLINNNLHCPNNMILFNQMNNKNMNQITNNNCFLVVVKGTIYDFDGCSYEVNLQIPTYPEEKVIDFKTKFFKIEGIWTVDIYDIYKDYKFIFNGNNLDDYLTIGQLGITNKSMITVIDTKGVKGAGYPPIQIHIYIKFIKFCNFSMFNCNKDLNGLLKLCLLKEISSKIKVEDIKTLQKFPDIIYYIMTILKNPGQLFDPRKEIKENIENILNKTGHNILNFSNFVDGEINPEHILKMMNMLNKNDMKEIIDTKMRLGKYNEYVLFFEKEFKKSLRQSIFEFSVVSLVILDRADFDSFVRERTKCPNRIDRILYHGTQIHPISCILTGLFRRSVERCYQHGKGVYFTDTLDYCWFYGGTKNNRGNTNMIPKIGDNFTAISSLVYYNRDGFLKVKDYKTRIQPGKNEINFAYAGCNLETIDNPDFRKFVGTEYVVWDYEQICPFMSVKLKRVPYCLIWRDNNFSEKPVFNNEFDAIFKKFLKERIKYIKQSATFNIYPCQTTEEALKLVRRKKYNKIILISNVGADLGGKTFVDEARKIIGNNVIVLFLSYSIKHINWIKNYKNALFSNEAKFYEEYFDCFKDEVVNDNIKKLINKVENHYKVKFNFDAQFLYFPHYKEEGKFSDLSF